MMTVLLFSLALLAHLGCSAWLVWRNLECVERSSSVPSRRVYSMSEELAERDPERAQWWLGMASSGHEKWQPRGWTMVYALGGVGLWAAAVAWWLA